MPIQLTEAEGYRDEHPQLPSHWTLDTLYVHLSRVIADQARRMDDHTVAVERTASAAVESSERALQAALVATERALQAALVSSEKAIAKSDIATEKRFESVNEFRATLSDASANFMTRSESDARHETLQAKIQANTEALNSRIAAGLASLAEKIEVNVLAVSRIEAAGVGANRLWGYIAGGVGLLIGLVGVAVGVITFMLRGK
jgi:hypothetical protein